MTVPSDQAGAMDYSQVLALCPQRVPLVDRVVRCEPGTVIETWKAVSGGEQCYLGLPGGLPESAYDYPEALLLEAFAQSAALLWARTTGRAFTEAPSLAGTRGVTFHRTVGPGSLLRTVAKLVPGTAATMFFCGRTCLASGELVLTVDNLVLTVRQAHAVLRAANH
jgi:3-hydroxyacyl-[acyl-carrier-protein] dehydratase